MKKIFVVFVTLFWASSFLQLAQADQNKSPRPSTILGPPQVQRSEVESAVETVNNLRKNLVQGINYPVNKKVFKAVCSPVGLRIKTLKKEKGFLIRQAAIKNRNPQNIATVLEQEAIGRFQREPKTTSFWTRQSGSDHYFRRINVQKECLACHGAKEKRPAFVQKKYPQDRAFGFSLGHLRGLYHVKINREVPSI